MSKIFWIADAHMSRLLYDNRRDIEGDAYRALASVVDAILEDPEKDKALVLAGDNLDKKHPVPMDIVVLDRECARLRAAGIEVYGIEGNHDRFVSRAGQSDTDSDLWIDVLSNIQHIDGKTVDIFGTKVHGVDYVQGESVYDILNSVPECDILVMHQPLSYLEPFEPYTVEPEGISEAVSKAVVCGHVHVADMRQNSRGLAIVSPGALHARHLTAPRGSFVSFSEGKFKLLTVPYHRRMARTDVVEAGDIAKLDATLERCVSEDGDGPDTGRKYVLGVRYIPSFGEDVGRICDKYAGKVHVILTPTSEVTVADNGEETSFDMSEEALVSRAFEQLGIDKGSRKELYQDMLALVQGHFDAVMKRLLKFEEELNEIGKSKA